MKSTTTKYGWFAISIHWIVATLIFIQLASGFRATGLTDDSEKAGILLAHMTVGFIILLLMIVRLAWWVFLDKKPASPADDPAWQTASAKAVHYGFLHRDLRHVRLRHRACGFVWRGAYHIGRDYGTIARLF